MPGPRKIMPGGGMKRNAKGIQAARLLLEWIEDSPELAKDIHPIVDLLTKVIRQSVAPTRPPSRASDELPTGPTLDATPTGMAEGSTGPMSGLIAQMQSGIGA